MARHRLRKIDGRSRHGRLWRAVERELTAALGGNLSVQQTILVATCADLTVRCTVLSETLLTAPTDEAAQEAERRYVWFCDKLRRCLAQLGIEKREPRQPSLAEVLAEGSGKAA